MSRKLLSRADATLNRQSKPASGPVSAQAVGQVRLLRRRLAEAMTRMGMAAESVPHAVVFRAAFRSHRLAAPEWARILAAMPPPYRRDHAGRLAQWRLLRPAGRLLEVGDTLGGDTAVLVKSLTFGRVNGAAGLVEHPWGLAFTDHALCRLLERSGYTADPEGAMQEAHDLLLAAPGDLAAVLEAEVRWAIPAGPGAFLATLRRTNDGEPDLVVLTADTWVSVDQLRPEQEAQVAAIRLRRDGPTLGDGLLRPMGTRLAAGRGPTAA